MGQGGVVRCTRARTYTCRHTLNIQVLEASIAPSQRSLSNHMTTWHHHSPGTELFLHGPVSAHAPLCCIALHPKLNREFTCQMGACYWMASHYKISPHPTGHLGTTHPTGAFSRSTSSKKATLTCPIWPTLPTMFF